MAVDDVDSEDPQSQIDCLPFLRKMIFHSCS